MSPSLVITIFAASWIWHFHSNSQMRQFAKIFWNENTWRVISIENKGSLSCPASPETEQYCFENHVCGFENHNNQGFMIFSLLAVSYDFVFVFTRNADVVLLAGWGHWAAPLGRNVEHDFLLIITQFSFSQFRYLSWVKSLNCRRKSGWESNWVQQ